MKKVLFILFLTLGSLAVNAQEAKWYTDMDEAMALSEKTKKPMLLFFTGSDWCGWCIRLQKEVLKTPEFAAWAKDNVILFTQKNLGPIGLSPFRSQDDREKTVKHVEGFDDKVAPEGTAPVTVTVKSGKAWYDYAVYALTLALIPVVMTMVMK